nr:protein ADP-ribosylarginine hydrolase-like [Chelonoidis abingdonii]
MGDMEGRKPGPTSILGTSQLRPGEPAGYRIPFNPSATGCGAAMRSMAIGLRWAAGPQGLWGTPGKGGEGGVGIPRAMGLPSGYWAP